MTAVTETAKTLAARAVDQALAGLAAAEAATLQHNRRDLSTAGYALARLITGMIDHAANKHGLSEAQRLASAATVLKALLLDCTSDRAAAYHVAQTVLCNLLNEIAKDFTPAERDSAVRQARAYGYAPPSADILTFKTNQN